jgi:uncharacterized membrane protein
MTQIVITVLLWSSALGSALIAGLFFAFSTFIMTALGRIAPGHGASAMQSINRTILKSMFMPVFMGTTLMALILFVWAALHWGHAGSAWMLAAGLLYVVGMFGRTMVFNVPLHNALDKADIASPEGALLWARYLKEWTMWNHVRTVASLLACALYIGAIVALASDAKVGS